MLAALTVVIKSILSQFEESLHSKVAPGFVLHEEGSAAQS